jgi:hypothetical protein
MRMRWAGRSGQRTSVTDLELEAQPKVIVPSTSVVSVAMVVAGRVG